MLHKFAQKTADCDIAFHQQFPDRSKPVATRRREVESSAGQRETGREYAPVRGAKFDRFRQDARLAVDLAK